MFVIKEKKDFLLERLSDTVYTKVVEHLFNVLNKPNIFIPTTKFRSLKEKTIEVVEAAIDLKSPDLQYLWRDFQFLLNAKEFVLFKKIFVSPIYLFNILDEFRLILAPQELNPNAGATMSHNGRMTIYYSGWKSNIVPNEKGVSTDPMAQKILFSIRNGNILSNVKETFVHEFTHYINAIRTTNPVDTNQRITRRSKGGSKQFDIATKAYAESTEELQARLVEVYDKIYNLINSQDIRSLNNVEKKILYMIAKNNKKSFIYYFKQFSILAYNQHLVDQKFVNKTITRLSSAFDEFYNMDTPLMKSLKENPDALKSRTLDIEFNNWFDSQKESFGLKLKKIISKVKSFFGKEE